MCNLPESVHFVQELHVLSLVQWQGALPIKGLLKEPKWRLAPTVADNEEQARIHVYEFIQHDSRIHCNEFMIMKSYMNNLTLIHGTNFSKSWMNFSKG